MVASDAHDVACLLDGRMSGDLLHHVVARAPARLDAREDVNVPLQGRW